MYSIKDYERFADDFQRRRFGLAGCLPAKLVEVCIDLLSPASMHSIHSNRAVLCQADYWRQVSSPDNPVVEYGNDVEGTAFCAPDQQDPLGSSSWNLQVLCLLTHSLLTCTSPIHTQTPLLQTV